MEGTDGPLGFELNAEQQYGRDMIRMLIDRPDRKCGLLLGRGGTGKTATIRAAKDLLRNIVGDDGFAFYAPTGKAASHLPQGCTLHSKRSGFGLPVKQEKFKPLDGPALQRAQARLENTKVIVVDEFSMVRQREVYYLHKQLQAITGKHDAPFGGLVVLFLGDPAQMPPVGGRVAWDGSTCKNKDDEFGYQLYTWNFDNVIELTEVRRVDSDDDEAEYFTELLDRIRDGTVTHADYDRLLQNSRGTIGDSEFARRFNDDEHEVTCLFCTNKEVNAYNSQRLKKLGEKIMLIEAKHTGPKAKQMGDDAFMGLKTSLMLAIGAKVYCTANVCTWAGLVNGVSGKVVSIVYDEGVQAPNLPRCVVVDFGKNYKGPAFFGGEERSGWVPIHPMVARELSKGTNGVFVENTREMFPLNLAWAWTIWKSQGMTIDHKLVLDLGKNEKEHGLTYVAFSRARRLRDIGIIGEFTKTRITESIRKQAKMKSRQAEEARLRGIALETKEAVDEWRSLQQ
jgi:ATP-dependent exoDNAse (exonuclease V) alpha subunit